MIHQPRKDEREMFKHYITKYWEDGQHFAEAWLQLNIFGRAFCFWKKKIVLK